MSWKTMFPANRVVCVARVSTEVAQEWWGAFDQRGAKLQLVDPDEFKLLYVRQRKVSLLVDDVNMGVQPRNHELLAEVKSQAWWLSEGIFLPKYGDDEVVHVVTPRCIFHRHGQSCSKLFDGMAWSPVYEEVVTF